MNLRKVKYPLLAFWLFIGFNTAAICHENNAECNFSAQKKSAINASIHLDRISNKDCLTHCILHCNTETFLEHIYENGILQTNIKNYNETVYYLTSFTEKQLSEIESSPFVTITFNHLQSAPIYTQLAVKSKSAPRPPPSI